MIGTFILHDSVGSQHNSFTTRFEVCLYVHEGENMIQSPDLLVLDHYCLSCLSYSSICFSWDECGSWIILLGD
jgi:hypothetical protein